jgi:hypothetical protein
MRTVERFLVEQNLKTLYERLRSAKSPGKIIHQIYSSRETEFNFS